MDGLRLSLIVAGIIVVALVYFWTARRRRIDREAGSFDRFEAWSDDTRDPLVDDADDPYERLEQEFEPDVDDVVQSTPEHDAVPEATETVTPPASSADAAHETPPPHAADAVRETPPPAASAISPGPDVLQGLDAIADALDERDEQEPTLGELSDLESERAAPPAAPDLAAASKRGADAPRRPRSGARRKAAEAQTELELTPPSEAPDAGAEMVVVLNVMARGDEQLDGEAIHASLKSAGLHFGEMQAYHYFPNGRSDPQTPLFSVLNAVNPGTLDPADKAELHTPGIALVMRLPGPGPALESFETMRRMGERLASELNAQLCDSSRSTLTRQAANHLREQIAEYGRRKRLGG